MKQKVLMILVSVIVVLSVVCFAAAVADNAAIALGVNCYDGKICCKNLADSYADYDYVDIHTLV